MDDPDLEDDPDDEYEPPSDDGRDAALDVFRDGSSEDEDGESTTTGSSPDES